MKYKKWLRLVFVLLVTLVFSGCTGNKSTKEDPIFEKWKDRREESKAYSPPAKTQAIELPERIKGMETLEEEAKGKPERPLPTQEVSLRMHKSNVITVLRALARAANQDLLISPNVEGEISVNIQDTPWDQVFRGILRTHGFAYTWEGDIIRVMTVEDMEYDLKIDAIQKKRKIQEIGLKRVEPLLTKIIDIDYSDANKLKENLQGCLTKDEEGKPRGSIMVDEHTNAVIIQAIRDDIVRMIPLIQKLDRPTRQILIEANIIEASRETARELGIQWGGLYHTKDYWITPGANTGGVMGNSLSTGIDPTTGIAANFPADLADNEGAGLTLGFVAEKIGKGLLNVQLSALEEDGKLNILSSPSITTLDNQPAIIESGSEVPFQSIDNEGNIDIEYKKAVLRLEVIPHVVDQEMLSMRIVVHKDEIDFTNRVLGNPTILIKKAETNVMLLDGETTVIGGLSKETITDSDSGVPWLKDIPIFGYLFKGEDRRNKMEEVLIFITPHVLKEKELVPKK